MNGTCATTLQSRTTECKRTTAKRTLDIVDDNVCLKVRLCTSVCVCVI